MREKLLNFFNSKTFLLVISFICAIVAGMFVLNLNNPITEQSLEIPLTVINNESAGESGLSASSKDVPENITVTVTGRQSLINTLTSHDFEVNADLSSVNNSGKQTINISKPVCNKLGVKIKKYTPSSFDCAFDKKCVKTLRVVIDYDEALLKEGYEFISVYPDTESIQVSGLESEVSKLEYISIDLNKIIEKGSIDSNKSASYIGNFITSDGEDVTSRFDPVSVIVKTEVGKRVRIVYSVIGEPEKGYYYNSNSISNDKIMIQGSGAETKKIQTVNIGTVSIEGLNESVKKDFEVEDFLPDGVSVYGNSKVSVNVEILEFEHEEFVFDIKEISLVGIQEALYEYEFEPETVTVLLKGRREVLNQIKKSSLEPTLELGDKIPGNYVVPLKMNDEIDADIIGEYTVNVTITEIGKNN